MSLYVVIIEDRHVDVDVEVFESVNAAVGYARHQAQSLCRNPEAFEEHDTPHDIPEWLYHATYSTEGDSITVVEKELR